MQAVCSQLNCCKCHSICIDATDCFITQKKKGEGKKDNIAMKIVFSNENSQTYLVKSIRQDSKNHYN